MNHSTPKSSNGDIHELRFRISQLEHLIVNSSLNSSPAANFSSLPSNSSLLQTSNGLIERMNELEGLLAASELDNKSLRKQIDLLKAERNRQEVVLLEKVFKKDQELKDLQHGHNLLEAKYKKAQTKLENIQDYINGLPCQEELDEAQSIVAKLQEDNQLLSGKISRMTEQNLGLHQSILQKEKALQDVQVKLEELKPLEEAELIFLKEKELQSMDLTNPKKVSELLTVQKAQMIRSSKVITILRDKLSRLEEQKAEAVIKIANQESDIESLQEQFLSTQLKMDKMEQKIEGLEQERIRILSESDGLRNEIEQRDTYLSKRDEQISNLRKLVTEIDLCVNEVQKLVELGQNIATGEEPPVAILLGLSDDLELHMQSLTLELSDQEKDEGSSCTPTTFMKSSSSDCLDSGFGNDLSFDPNDTEWALDRLKKVRDIRRNLGSLRDLTNDLYTDMLGGKVEGCKVQ